jgi:predicted GNAT family N-acyltransferase
MALPEGARLIRLTPDHQFKPFNCGDDDLNDFFVNASIPHLNSLLAVTYVIENETETICFFSLLNDKISVSDVPQKEQNKWGFKFFSKTGKQYKSHPSVKIGRYAVTNSFRNKGIGREVMNYIKYLFTDNNRTGCRFITVDAYADSIGFYEKMGFKFMTKSDRDESERHMYFDLISLT